MYRKVGTELFFIPQTNTAYQTKINYLIELKVLKVTEIRTTSNQQTKLYDYMYIWSMGSFWLGDGVYILQRYRLASLFNMFAFSKSFFFDQKQ